jgi:2-(1,2-epoxy-1,2-dihydrophenyl)acetyl-CoA isomerase
MNRPERRNALNGELIGALDDAVRRMADDPEAKVIVLTGSAPPGGHGGFCSGGDIKGGGRGAPGSEKGVPPDALSGDLSRHDLHAAMLLHLMPKPTIAMVGGPAVGAGCSLAAACDLRFASEDAVFAANFSPNGLSGDYGGSFFWTRIAGTALARRLYLLNEKIPGPRALELAMVHAVLPPQRLRAYTYEIAGELVRTPATLLALVKDNLNLAEDEVERRRWLFAHEAENQASSAKAMMERMAQKQKAADQARGY